VSKEREYQVGDIVECTKLFYGDGGYFTVGKHYRVDQVKLVTAVKVKPKTLTKPELELEKITIAGKDYEVTSEKLSEIMEKLK